MAQLRKNEPTLIYGDWVLVDPENPAVFACTPALRVFPAQFFQTASPVP